VTEQDQLLHSGQLCRTWRRVAKTLTIVAAEQSSEREEKLMNPSRPAFASGEFLRFLAAGAIGFAVDSGLLLMLVQGLGWPPLLARAPSFAAALVATWLINRLWTFRAGSRAASPGKLGAEFLSYGAVQVTGGAANYAVYALIVAFTGQAPMQLVGALAAGAAVGLAINYLGARHFVFAREGQPRSQV
jgi:putative flippase GtrA